LNGSDDFHKAPSSQAPGTPNSSTTSWEVVSPLEFQLPPLANQLPDDLNALRLGDGAYDRSSSTHGEIAADGSSTSAVDLASLLLEAELAQPSSPNSCCSASEAGAALGEALFANRVTKSAKVSSSNGPPLGGFEAVGQNHAAKMIYSCPGQVLPDGSSDASCTTRPNSTPSISGRHAMLGVAATVEIKSLRAFLGEEVPAFPFAGAAVHHSRCSSSAEPLVVHGATKCSWR